MDARRRVDSFDFHDDRFFDEQIQAVAEFQREALIDDRQGDLTSDSDAAHPKLVRKTLLIGS